MESAKCKICFRQFSNRKALGGHMRSHMAKFSVVHQKQQLEEDQYSPKFLGLHIDDDQESDTDTPSDQIMIRRRSKRACRSIINRKATGSPDAVSIASDDVDHHHHHHHSLVSVEEAAQLLLLLSRDHHHHQTTREREKRVPPSAGKDRDFTLLLYRCDTCHKGFQSYQALGGHRASHKKLKFESEEEEDDDDDDAVAAAAPAPAPAPAPINERTFKCPFCFKVFESGQAMGGHKKIHMSSAATAAASRSRCMPMPGHSFMDLNLPAAPEDDNSSQVDDPSIILMN